VYDFSTLIIHQPALLFRSGNHLLGVEIESLVGIAGLVCKPVLATASQIKREIAGDDGCL